MSDDAVRIPESEHTAARAEDMRGWIAAETLIGNLKPEDGARRLTAVNKAQMLGEPIPDITREDWVEGAKPTHPEGHNLTGHSKPETYPQSYGFADSWPEWRDREPPLRMSVEQARVAVRERLGIAWELSHVRSTLKPGPRVGAPTTQVIEVVLDYHPGYRGETDAEGISYGVTGPHLTFEGIGDSIETALAVAMGSGLAHTSVQDVGSPAEHTWRP